MVPIFKLEEDVVSPPPPTSGPQPAIVDVLWGSPQTSFLEGMPLCSPLSLRLARPAGQCGASA